MNLPKLNDIMYHWNYCDYCKGTSLGDILYHLDCIKKGMEIIKKEDLKFLERFPLMTDTLEGVRP